MKCDSAAVVSYEVDADGRIVEVCEHWWPFARDNQAPELHPDLVLGKPLMGYIADDTSRYLYGQLMGRTRASGGIVEVDIRCDSPDKRRFLKIRLSALSGGTILFESRTLREESRPPVALLDRSLPRSPEWICICSWCKRIRVGPDWLEVEQAIAKLPILQMPQPPQMTHGMCPTCYQAARGARPSTPSEGT